MEVTRYTKESKLDPAKVMAVIKLGAIELGYNVSEATTPRLFGEISHAEDIFVFSHEDNIIGIMTFPPARRTFLGIRYIAAEYNTVETGALFINTVVDMLVQLYDCQLITFIIDAGNDINVEQCRAAGFEINSEHDDEAGTSYWRCVKRIGA